MPEKLNMNYGWKFFEGEFPQEIIKGHYDTYMHAKAKNGPAPSMPNFYDGEFEDVDLPHDYVIKGKPSEEYNESQGSLKRNGAWYRRSFQLPESDRGKRIVLLFDGAGMKTEVWVNGQPAGRNESMYNSFYIDITPYLVYENEINIVAVHISNKSVEGWWYEGAGIYRSVWMLKMEAAALDVWGTKAETIEGTDGSWQVRVESTVYSLLEHQEGRIRLRITAPTGEAVSEAEYPFTALFGENVYSSSLKVEHPKLWSVEETHCYRLTSQVIVNEKVWDETETSFGFRAIAFDPDKGFFLNGKGLKLRGVCLHQDHGELGVAVPRTVQEYRVRKLKEAGVNAIRTAHHNPDPQLLDICDKEGILVIDENRWFNFSEDVKKQLKNMCLRDRNHPSVIMWSIGNEEPLQDTLEGKELARQMKAFLHRMDSARPVTLALNGGYYDSCAAQASDAVGVNYRIEEYPLMHQAHPDKPIVATESGASANHRGIYEDENVSEVKGGYSSAYDRKRTSFGSSYAAAIAASERNDFVCGTFLWAGIEYRGESVWPMLCSGIGILDNCGMEKDSFYLVKSLWTEKPMIHVMPHWNWPGREGEEIRVEVYTNLPQAELFLNGKSIGIKKAERFCPVHFDVPYEPGILRAAGLKDGKEEAADEAVTALQPQELKLDVVVQASDNGEDVFLVECSLIDVSGVRIPDADAFVHFSVRGQGKLLTVDSGDPKDHGHARCGRRMFSGKLQAAVKASEKSHEILLSAEASELGLKTSVVLYPTQGRQISRVPLCRSVMEISNVREWPKEYWEEAIREDFDWNDMNTGQPVAMKGYQGVNGGRVFTSRLLVPGAASGQTPVICFRKIRGKGRARIFHDKNCWPNPEPKEFLTVCKEFNCGDTENVKIPLLGFCKNEKVNMVLQMENEEGFFIGGIEWTVINGDPTVD